MMGALHRRDPSIRFDIYTSVPQWFFAESFSGLFAYHFLVTDVGMVQLGPMQEDLNATVEKLGDMIPFAPTAVRHLARQVLGNHCCLILCDIAPLGIAVAQAAGIPSILVENFTWDWVYQGYAGQDHRIVPYIDYLKQVFADADHHVQTQPVCRPDPARLATMPVSRKSRKPSRQIRDHLDIPMEAPLVMLTLGGIPPDFKRFKQPQNPRGFYVIVPGGAETYQAKDTIRLLPHHSGVYHPDLVGACDAVIGKLGYSTLAEVFHAGLPFGYIPRHGFRESAVLEAFIKEHMQALPLTEAQLQDGSWIDRVPDLLARPKVRRKGMNGADQVARYIYRLLRQEF